MGTVGKAGSKAKRRIAITLSAIPDRGAEEFIIFYLMVLKEYRYSKKWKSQ